MSVKTSIFVLVLLLANCNFSFALQYKVLHSFSGPPNDASYVISSLVFDSQGNLYGTSANGGSNFVDGSGDAGGAVYELTPNGDGTWDESVIYSFCSNFNGIFCSDGESAWGGLIMDAKGNLYGTTFEGGTGGVSGSLGGGVVFELSPPVRGGAWSETVLYNFCSIN